MTVERFKQCMPVHRRCLLPSIMLAMLLGGCGDTSKSPEAPTVLGTPPSTAYLGADYSYNFGAHGGDNLLNYSLSNAPSWLALEDTTNNARPGIVLRGQPGISGGNRGEADVGTYESIKISSTDGALLGDGDFTIEVLHNALMIQDTIITEGEPFTPDLNDRDEEVCEFPDMNHTWEAEVEHRRLRTDTGSDNLQYESADREYTAWPALVEVQLNEPSVEPVSVMFRVQEDFPRAEVGPEGDRCGEENNGEPCEYASGNREKAIYGEDFVFNGGPDGRDMVAPGSVFPEPPEYIHYVDEGTIPGDGEDGNARFGRGVLTFEPGITSCFIPVWVFDDDLAEDTESFEVILEEVTEGLASLEEEGAVSDLSIDIEDTTPRVRFDLDELVVTAGTDTERNMTVSLSRANDTGEALWAGIQCVDESDEDETGVCERVTLKYGDETRQGDGSSLPVRFATGESELSIRLEVDDNGNGDGYPYADDEQFELTFDRSYQFGLEFAAGVSENEAVDVFINEWEESLALGTDRWTAVTAGTFGEAYLAGVADGGDELIIRSINRLGDTDGDDSAVLTEQDGWQEVADGVPPKLAFTGRSTGTSNAPEIVRNLAVGYTDRDSGDGVLALFRSRLEESGEDDNDQLVIVCEGEPAEAAKKEGRLWDFSSSEESDLGPANLKTLTVSAEGDLFWGGTQDDDILLSRINSVITEDNGEDTEENGNNCEDPERERTEASFQWSSLVSAGGGLESDVVGLTRPTFGNMNALGWSQGDIGSGNDLGGDTFVFMSLDQDGEVVSDNQFGTNENDRFSHAVEAGTRMWAAGTGQVRYERDDNGFIDEEASTPLGHNNPFVFAITGGGNVEGLINLGEESGNPQAYKITALAAEGTTAIVGGDSTDGAGSAPFLASVTLDAQDEELEQDWRIELDGASSVVDLSLFEGRKLFVLLEMPGGGYELRLYSRESTLLTR